MDPIQVTPEAPPQPQDPNPTPPSMQDVLAGSPPPQTPDLGLTNQPMPTEGNQKPSLWRSVLTGALSGLAGSAGAKSFGGGLAAGAAGEMEQQRQARLDALAKTNQESQIRFRDAQAAQLVAEAHINDYKLSALPQQLQDEHNANTLQTVKELQNLGVNPTIVGDNTHAHATAALNQLTAAQGSVPPLFTVNLGNQVVGYDLSQLTQGDGSNILGVINKYGAVLGRPEITAQQYAQMPPADRINLVNSSLGALNVVPDPSKIGAQIATAENQAATYGALPSWKKDAAIADRLNKNVTFLKNAQSQFDAHQVRQEAAVQGAKSQVEANVKNANAAKKPDMLIGSMPDGSQVAGTAAELEAAGIKNPIKLPSSEVGKVEIARSLISPGGLFDNVAADITALNKQGQLGVVASRWNNILTNKLGTGDQNFARLSTDLGLLSTALMQAHVGSKGSNEMMEHFKQTIGDPSISTAPILLARLGASWDYINHKAMRLPAAKGGK